MNIWQASVLVSAVAAITLVATDQVNIRLADSITPNAIVVEAFRAIPGEALAVLASATAAIPMPSLESPPFESSSNARVAAEFDRILSEVVELPCLESQMRASAIRGRLDNLPAAQPMTAEQQSGDCGKHENEAAGNPAKTALQALNDIPMGTPSEEIDRAAAAFGVDAGFMKAVARIESGLDPQQRTGSYIGLFQLSRSEFARYGSGDILSPRDNAMAAARKFAAEAATFESVAHRKPTYADLYLIHQQGWDGAAEHVGHPRQIAWKSMCATREGIARGEKWCKRAIWGNTLQSAKREWSSVNRMTSGAFMAMWRERLGKLVARYRDAALGHHEA